MHQPEEPSLDSSHPHHGREEEAEQLEPERSLHPRHGVNQKELSVPVLTEGVQSSPAIGMSPSGSSDHDQLASNDHRCLGGQSSDSRYPEGGRQPQSSEARLV